MRNIIVNADAAQAAINALDKALKNFIDRADKSLTDHDEIFIFEEWTKTASYYVDADVIDLETADDLTHIDISISDTGVMSINRTLHLCDVYSFITELKSAKFFNEHIKPLYLGFYTVKEAAAILFHADAKAADFFAAEAGALDVVAFGSDNATLGETAAQLDRDGYGYLIKEPGTIFYGGYIVANVKTHYEQNDRRTKR